MEMSASQVIKGALGGGARERKKDGGRHSEKEEEDEGRRHERDIFKSTRVERSGNWDVKRQVSISAGLTSSDAKVIVALL